MTNPIQNYERIRARLSALIAREQSEPAKRLLESVLAQTGQQTRFAVANPVTGHPSIPQRDYDVQQLRRQAEKRAYNTDHHFYVAVLDIDKFNNFNNTYGHDVGNLVLLASNDILRDSIRTYDTLGKSYHLHGEEKSLIFQAPNDQTACLIADRCRRNIKEQSPSVTVTPRYPLGFSITESIGLTRWNIHSEDFATAEQRADSACNLAKGR